jgi:hypothetical protein
MSDDGYTNTDTSEEEQVCQIYSVEDSFTSFVQALLAAFALASLWIKRLQERPQRDFLTWFLDVSKQAFGACYAHVLNMVIASIIAGNARGGQILNDECAWYAINYVIDTTLGLVITIIFLDWLDKLANHFQWTALMNSGVYVGREGICHWVWQMFAWIIILSLCKVVICAFMWILAVPLAYMGMVLFAPLQSNIRFELLFVMIFFPGVLNVVYFWITDSYLKADHKDSNDEGGKEMSPVSHIGETVTPYAQMGDNVGDELNGGHKSVSSRVV